MLTLVGKFHYWEGDFASLEVKEKKKKKSKKRKERGKKSSSRDSGEHNLESN